MNKHKPHSSAVHFDQFIVNAAVRRGVTSKRSCTLGAQILTILKQVVAQTYNFAE